MTVTHSPAFARVVRARQGEEAAFRTWLDSRDEDVGVRAGLWASWIVSRRALDRAISILQAEVADRARLGQKGATP